MVAILGTQKTHRNSESHQTQAESSMKVSLVAFCSLYNSTIVALKGMLHDF